MLPYQQRMQDELSALEDKLEKLYSFCSTVSFSNLKEEDKLLLEEQSRHMFHYAEVLKKRLKEK